MYLQSDLRAARKDKDALCHSVRPFAIRAPPSSLLYVPYEINYSHLVFLREVGKNRQANYLVGEIGGVA